MNYLPTIALLGATGLLGTEFERVLSASGANFEKFARGSLDLEDSIDSIAKKLDGKESIINCVGFTRVDEAETQQEECFFANAEVPRKLAKVCELTGAKLIHFSTDYVFAGGQNRPYSVTDLPDPKSAYGASKALGEAYLLESSANFSIVRTSWLYGRTGRSFPASIARTLQEKGFVEVVNDQVGQPTWTRDVVGQVLEFSRIKQAPKIIHAVSSGRTSWAEFAVEVANFLGYQGRLVVRGIPSILRPTIAKRPAWSVLDNSSDLVEPIGNWLERWIAAADEVLGDQ